jgi:hypothetical protein
MKTMKVALLASAALAAVSVSARADDTAAIKAQLEALTARIAQLEAAPAVPVGYSLLTITEGTATKVPGLDGSQKVDAGYADKATIIGILPTADVPASTTIEWSGYARAAIVYSDYEDNNDDNAGTDGSGGVTNATAPDDDGIDVFSRGQLKVTGKTDTAVGEVGARLEMRGNIEGQRDGSERLYWETYWGWWAMTPELTLGGGFAGSLGNIGYGYDGSCNCYYTDNADVYSNPGDTSQMRLTWASGPLSFAVALEDASGSGSSWGDGDDLGVAAEIKYSGDTVSAEIAGTWRGKPDTASVPWSDYTASTTTDTADFWQVGAGLGFALGEMASISLAANVGETVYGADFWNVNGLISANLSDTVHGEIGAGWKEYGDANGYSDSARDIWAVLAGIYYDPVPQLTIGLEAEYSETEQDEGFKSNASTVDLVTVFRF